MLSKAFFLTALLCPSLLAASHNAYAQGTVTYDNPPSSSPSDNSSSTSTSQDGDVSNSSGGYVGSIGKDGDVSNSSGGYVGSIGKDGDISNSSGGYVGHAPNRGLGALMLLNVVPLQ